MRIPLDQIDADALPRDRTLLDAGALAELQASIAASGLRQPIEVFATGGAPKYGLISGYRRLHAFRDLHALTGHAHYACIDAVLRTPDTRAAALAAMVEENDIRQSLSPWERAAIATRTVAQGLFPTADAAIAALYPHAARQKRAKLRGIAEVIEAMGDLLIDPEALTERQLLRLGNTLRLGWRELIISAIEDSGATTPAAQWQAALPVLEEAEVLVMEHRDTSPNRPRRLVHLGYGLTIRRERTAQGWLLYITGRKATEAVVGEVLDQVELMFTPE